MKKTLLFLLTAVTFSAFGTNVTFKVDMKGSGMDYDTVYIVGTLSDWTFVPMTSEGDSIHSVTLELTDGDSAVYYFITQNTWDGYQAAREPQIPNECGDSLIATWAGDRAFIVPLDNIEYTWIWGTCDNIVGINNLRNNIDLGMYPNPTNGILNLDLSLFSSSVSVDVIDITGKIRQSYSNLSNTVHSIQLDVKNGIYFLKVSDGINTIHQRIIVN